MNNLTFNFNRFLLLLKREISTGHKKPLIIGGAVLGILFLNACFKIYTNNGYHDSNFILFPLMLFLGGFSLTSVIFYEFNNKIGTHHYLSLPASALEKLLSKWIISAILFPLVAVLLFLIYSFIADSLYNSYTGNELDSWSLTNWWSLFFLRLYFVAQSVFLVGAIAFEKFTFFKTSLSTFLMGLSLAILIAIFYRIIFAKFFDGLILPKEDINMQVSPEAIEFIHWTIQPTVEYILWFLVIPLMGVVGYFKLKEKEA